jgi:hypothetical protein
MGDLMVGFKTVVLAAGQEKKVCAAVVVSSLCFERSLRDDVSSKVRAIQYVGEGKLRRAAVPFLNFESYSTNALNIS